MNKTPKCISTCSNGVVFTVACCVKDIALIFRKINRFDLDDIYIYIIIYIYMGQFTRKLPIAYIYIKL